MLNRQTDENQETWILQTFVFLQRLLKKCIRMTFIKVEARNRTYPDVLMLRLTSPARELDVDDQPPVPP